LLAWLLVSSNSKIIYIFYTKNAQKSATKKTERITTFSGFAADGLAGVRL
jgi:uncharacterized protein YdeI (YjbR/CyaY-like superfamily)